ncbi:hypothetical protein H1S01_04670 [Heliobacterium chlorum]|uniref:Mor transcription activator domain-containing protein n=1 Tax=Heliobacterium chlorum TaxID=2698 RepID=A0ABR7T1S7_HELCL|nr:hypothetical protein [Heliobacterium chlorum]MBC9783804.1 hypothetical protein [Heliobacterium chlorum]
MIKDLPRYDRWVNWNYKANKYRDKSEQIISLYLDKLMSFTEIEGITGIKWWHVRNILKSNKVPLRNKSETWKVKRDKNFEEFRHSLNENTTIGELHRKYGFSKQYIKKILVEKGFEITHKSKSE